MIYTKIRFFKNWFQSSFGKPIFSKYQRKLVFEPEFKPDFSCAILSTFSKPTCWTLEFCGQNQRGDAQSLRLLDCLMIQQPPRKNCVEENHSNDDHNRRTAATFHICLASYSIKPIFANQLQKMCNTQWENCEKKSWFFNLINMLKVQYLGVPLYVMH